jgi:hypothetical protein
MAAATIRLQAFHIGCSLVEIACRSIFGDGRRHLGLHGEIDGVIRAAALLPEILDLFERSLQLLRIGSRAASRDVGAEPAFALEVRTLQPPSAKDLFVTASRKLSGDQGTRR